MSEKIIILTEEELNQITSRVDKIFEEIVKINKLDKTKEWIDNEEACQLLNISKRSLQNLRDTKQLPFTRPSGKVYYKMEDIQAYLSNSYTGKK